MANLTNLDLLATVASKTYVEDFETEKRVPDSKKRKRHCSSEIRTFDDIRALTPKALVDRFSFFAADEMSKKYYYHCRFLPGKCMETSHSFGNEAKAYNAMKLHLIAHLNEKNVEIDFQVFAHSPPLDEKPIWEDSVQKPPKKAKVTCEMASLEDSDSQMVSDVFQVPKSKKMLEYGSETSSRVRRKKLIPKRQILPKPENSNPLNLGSSLLMCKENTVSPVSGLNVTETEIAKFMSLNFKRNADMKKMKDLADSHCPPKFDHDYCYKGPNHTRIEKSEEREIFVAVKKRSKVQKQFIIKTPKFPYLHDMAEEYVVSEIVEIDEEGNNNRRRQRVETNCLDINNYLLSKAKEERPKFETLDSIDLLPIRETQDVTGSVLECVENKVSTKNAAACAPKLVYSSDNDENSENVKKVRKELALKHITQLNSKRKKHCQGPLMCQLCDDGRQFTAVASLMHHYRSHAGIKLYVCDVCQDTFTRQHSLNYHMMIHQNRSRFECEFCNKPFRHPSHFKEHLRRHTGETPFQCSICNMLFKTRNTYKRHLKMQHNKILTAHGIIDGTEEASTSSKKSKRKSRQ